jgi:hypothetical protein
VACKIHQYKHDEKVPVGSHLQNFSSMPAEDEDEEAESAAPVKSTKAIKEGYEYLLAMAIYR